MTILICKPIYDLGPQRPVPDFPAYIIDCLRLGSELVFTGALRGLLESKIVNKLTFDCRADSDALFHQFGISLENVLDVQVWHQGLRRATGELTPESPARFVQSLSRLGTKFLRPAETTALRSGADAPHENDSVGLTIVLCY